MDDPVILITDRSWYTKYVFSNNDTSEMYLSEHKVQSLKIKFYWDKKK